MSAALWLGLAAVALAWVGPAALPARVGSLGGSARLAVVAAGGGRARGIRVPTRAVVGVCAGGAVLAVAWRGGAALAIGAAAVLGLAIVLARDARSGRELSRRRIDLDAGVRVLVAELSAGSRPGAALRAAGGLAPSHADVFADAAAVADAGGDAAAALSALPDTRRIAVAWRLGQQTGAPLATVLARVADDHAAEAEQRRAATVALAGPQSSAAVLTGLPLLGLVLGYAMGADPTAFLFGTAAGRTVCCAGVLLDVGGVLWVRRILRRAARP